MKHLISCASYYGSGSSAVTDLVSEYQGVKSLTSYEFRFIQDIDGVMDLEYHLVMNPNRHNSGHALKRFWKLSKFNSGTWFDKRYERFFGGKYIELTKQYVDELTDVKFPGFWFMDMYERGSLYYYWLSIKWKLITALRLDKRIKLLPNEITYCSHPSEDKFLDATRRYISSLIEIVNPKDADYLMMDQLTPSSNIKRCLRYFDDNFRTIIVDRDPRDIFVINKTVWKTDIVPTDVEKFCKWFEFTHSCGKGQEEDRRKVLKIQFEDLIYNYEDSVKVIESFLDLDPSKHSQPFAKMNPQRSVHNTRLFESYENQEEVDYICLHLPEYLYDFSAVKGNEIKGVKPVTIKKF